METIKSAEIDMVIIYWMARIMNSQKFMDCNIDMEIPVLKLYLLLLETFDPTGGDRGMELATNILVKYNFNLIAELWTRMMRYFNTDKDAEQDFLIRFTEEINKETNIERQKMIKYNFRLFNDLISISKKYLFASVIVYFNRIGERFTFGCEVKKCMCSIVFVDDKLVLRDFVLEALQKKAEQAKIDEELKKILEDAKPVKVSQQKQTKSANKKREQEKKEREEYERRSAEAEAERQRQLKKKQQQKQAKKKA
jgi:hypothetical protein